jgi:hypothetical protein
MSEEIKQLKDEEQYSEPNRRQARRAARAGREDGKNWIGGVILIGIGLVFLLGNFTDFRIDNWWALFILIPVVAAWGNALRIYQAEGAFVQEARAAIAGSLFPLFVALIFLLEWDWSTVWPGFLVLAGVSALVGGWNRD